MAKVQSPVWNIIRGSIAGTTYLANQFGQIIARARTAPVQPQTTPQNQIRSAFTCASSQWESITDSDRELWDLYAQQTPYDGPFGPYTLPGRQMFLAVITFQEYLNLLSPGAVQASSAPPSIPGFFNIGPVKPASPAGPGVTGIGINVTVPAGNDAVIFAQRSNAFDPSRNRYQGPWISAENVIQPISAGSSGVISFTGLVQDKIYFTKVRAITKNGPHTISIDFLNRHVAETVV